MGSIRVKVDQEILEVKRRKALGLLAILAIHRDPVRRERIIELLWSELDSSRARASLRTVLSDLRNQPIGEWLLINRDTVALKPSVTVDVQLFRNGLEQVDTLRMIDGADEQDLVPILEAVVEKYQGDFLRGFTLSDSILFDDWQRIQSDYLEFDFIRALKLLSNCLEDLNQYERAILSARRLLELDPYDEHAHQVIMRGLVHTGQRAEAILHYESFAELLEADLDVSPTAETTALYENIKADKIDVSSPQPVRPQVIGNAPRKPTTLVGRQSALQEVKARLGVGGTQRPVTAIQGWPGLGKTTLVATLAHEKDLRKQFTDGVLWASLGEQPNLKGILQDWARSLELTLADETDLDSMVAQLTGAMRDRRVLLIVDDVWETEHGLTLQVTGENASIVYTTRFNDVARELAGEPANIYKLQVLSDDTAYELLKSLAPLVVQDYPNETLELLTNLEGLPLAIQVAGRLLHAEASMGWGVKDLLEELRAEANLLSAEVPAEIRPLEDETTPTITILLQKSTDRLPVLLQERFAYLGVFAPKPATFSLSAIRAVWEADDPRPMIRELVNRGLLEPLGDGRFQMHALLAMHARSMFGASDDAHG